MRESTQRSPHLAIQLVLPVIPAVLLLVAIVNLSLAQSGGGTAGMPGEKVLTRITAASDLFRASALPIVSADGTKITFISDSDFLGQGIPAQQQEVWLYDTITRKLTRVTTATESTRYSMDPHISADGSMIAFASEADLLGEGIADNQIEIWLYDVISGTLKRVTMASHPDRDSRTPFLNADATKLVFMSDSDFFSETIPPGQREIWLYDIATETFTRTTRSSQSDRQSFTPRTNADGSRIVFASDADFFGEGIGKDMSNIWLYDTETMTLTRITTGTSDISYWPSISADGTLIAYNGSGKFWDPSPTMGLMEIWLFDTTTAQLTRVTTASHPVHFSHLPNISADGSTIAFGSMEDFTGHITPALNYDVWLYDVASKNYTRVTTGTENYLNSDYVALNGDGSVAVFHSNNDLLNEGISAGQTEIWVYGPEPLWYDVFMPIALRNP